MWNSSGTFGGKFGKYTICRFARQIGKLARFVGGNIGKIPGKSN